MKRVIKLLLVLAMLLSICACGSAGTPTDTDIPENTEPPETPTNVQPDNSDSDEGLGIDAIGDIDVDSGLFDVTLTIPADFIGSDMTQEQLDENVKDKEYKSAVLNDDGSVTYVITKAQHKEMMDELSQSIDESLAKMVGSEDTPAIVKIEANDNYTQYKITLNTEEVGLSESIATLGLYICSGMYHIFNGTEPGNINIQFINEATGEIIEEANSNDLG